MSVTFSPAIRGRFGEREYYITTMKAQHAVDHIKSPSELFEVSARALDQRMQRELQRSNRVTTMASYLYRDYRFYGPLIVALKGGDPEFVPLEMSEPSQLIPLEHFDLGVLRFSGTENYFVLDGQHRLASIKAAIASGNDSIKEDDVSVVIVRHEDSQQGMENSRRLFTHLNRYAKRTTDSENITIEEDDGYAIVTRRLVREHPVLQDKIWYKARSLPQSGKDGDDPNAIDARDCFTTLQTVYNCNKVLLKRNHHFNNDWERVRPEPDLLDELSEECKKFWDGLRRVEAVELAASGKRKCSEFRPQEPEQRGQGHLLFRPIGQEALAEAVASIMEEQKSGFGEIDKICQDCAKIDWKLSSLPWTGLFFGEGGRMLSDNTRKRQNVGSQLLRYMLGVEWPNAGVDLLQEYREMAYPTNPNSQEAMKLKLPPKVN